MPASRQHASGNPEFQPVRIRILRLVTSTDAAQSGSKSQEGRNDTTTSQLQHLIGPIATHPAKPPWRCCHAGSSMDPWLNSISFWHRLPMCAPLVGPAAHARQDLPILVSWLQAVVRLLRSASAAQRKMTSLSHLGLEQRNVRHEHQTSSGSWRVVIGGANLFPSILHNRRYRLAHTHTHNLGFSILSVTKTTKIPITQLSSIC
jgi:hypothetical protein